MMYLRYDKNYRIIIDYLIQISDANFLSFEMMYQLLKRKSLGIPEFNVYLLLKEYILCITEEEADLFSNDKSNTLQELFALLVDFKKMTLLEITTIAEKGWLPKGKFQKKIQ